MAGARGAGRAAAGAQPAKRLPDPEPEPEEVTAGCAGRERERGRGAGRTWWPRAWGRSLCADRAPSVQLAWDCEEERVGRLSCAGDGPERVSSQRAPPARWRAVVGVGRSCGLEELCEHERERNGSGHPVRSLSNPLNLHPSFKKIVACTRSNPLRTHTPLLRWVHCKSKRGCEHKGA